MPRAWRQQRGLDHAPSDQTVVSQVEAQIQKHPIFVSGTGEAKKSTRIGDRRPEKVPDNRFGCFAERLSCLSCIGLDDSRPDDTIPETIPISNKGEGEEDLGRAPGLRIRLSTKRMRTMASKRTQQDTSVKCDIAAIFVEAMSNHSDSEHPPSSRLLGFS
ncbi:hypothetical protein BC567DRAFT_237507 [Phyllosticta citribraziliensis]